MDEVHDDDEPEEAGCDEPLEAGGFDGAEAWMALAVLTWLVLVPALPIDVVWVSVRKTLLAS